MKKRHGVLDSLPIPSKDRFSKTNRAKVPLAAKPEVKINVDIVMGNGQNVMYNIVPAENPSTITPATDIPKVFIDDSPDTSKPSKIPTGLANAKAAICSTINLILVWAKISSTPIQNSMDAEWMLTAINKYQISYLNFWIPMDRPSNNKVLIQPGMCFRQHELFLALVNKSYYRFHEQSKKILLRHCTPPKREERMVLKIILQLCLIHGVWLSQVVDSKNYQKRGTDTSVDGYLTERTCWWNEICKEEFQNLFRCKCPEWSFCRAPGRYYNAFCSMAKTGYIWYQPGLREK
ncbi:hypothetical protein HUJ05_012783 [Dendroctonus ponderosae]|nr:hypothetical protein HUJ05_012783 [Dendroctonus ponderosae]